jgi:Mce-associated membrane protein
MRSGIAGRIAWWAIVFVLTGATLAVSAVGGWEMQFKSRQPPPVADRLSERQAATRAASEGTVKVLSYSPDTLDQDFNAASAMLTGDFLAQYRQFTSQIVGPTARQKRVTTSATVSRAGVAALSTNAASILVFVNQTTTSADQPSPSTSASSVSVGLAKVNGAWLINSFNPE